MNDISRFDYIAAIAAIVSILALLLNFVIYRKSKKENMLGREHQLIDHFLNIDDMLIQYPNLCDAYKVKNRSNDIFAAYEKSMVAFAYKHLNIFSKVYNIYFSDMTDDEISRKRKRCKHSDQWYDFIERSLNDDTLLKRICTDIINGNPVTRDYGEDFESFIKRFLC